MKSKDAMAFIDSHCHLDFPMFDHDREQIMACCRDLSIDKLIMPGVYREDWSRLLDFCRKYDQLFVALGLHPCYLDLADESYLPELDDLLQKNPQVVAIGEIGLDFFEKGYDETRQRLFFQQQVQLAGYHKRPLILHVRKAHDQVASILKQLKFDQGGVVHCYSGSLQQAKKYLDLGFRLGIGGVITYPRSARLQKIVASLPLSSFLLETDAPDIPTSGHQRERNSPVYLIEIFNALADKRSEQPGELEAQLYHNTMATFERLKK